MQAWRKALAAYRWVYDSRHLKAECKHSGPRNSFYCLGHFKNVYDDDDERTGISSGTLRSAMEYGLPFVLLNVESKVCGSALLC